MQMTQVKETTIEFKIRKTGHGKRKLYQELLRCSCLSKQVDGIQRIKRRKQILKQARKDPRRPPLIHRTDSGRFITLCLLEVR